MDAGLAETTAGETGSAVICLSPSAPLACRRLPLADPAAGQGTRVPRDAACGGLSPPDEGRIGGRGCADGDYIAQGLTS